MVNISIDELSPGAVLGQDVYNQDKVLLLPAGTVLTQSEVDLIKKLGFKEIDIESRSATDAAVIKKFQQTYREAKNKFAGMIKYISDGNQVSIDEAYEVIESITDQMGSLYKAFTFLNQVKHLDDHTIGHSINVAIICGIINNWIGLEENVGREIIVAGLFHDIGKSGVPLNILNKPGPLTPTEWEAIKKHPLIGYDMLKKSKMPYIVQQGALLHHEREDGKGYPFQTRRLPLVAKMVAIADIYDAMTTTRSYRNKICSFQVMRDLQYGYFGILDTKLLMTFLNRIGECYIGERVYLNDGRYGEVVHVNPQKPTRPLIKTADGLVNLEDYEDIEVSLIL